MATFSTDIPGETGPVRVAWPYVFQLKESREYDDRYEITALFDPNDLVLSRMKQEAGRAVQELFPAGFPANGHNPFQDGNANVDKETGEVRPGYAGKQYVVFSDKKTPPAIVGPDGRLPITDRAVIYGGCWCNILYTCSAYHHGINSGVRFNLDGVQFIRDDQRIGGQAREVKSRFKSYEGASAPQNGQQFVSQPQLGGQPPQTTQFAPQQGQPVTGHGQPLSDGVPF